MNPLCFAGRIHKKLLRIFQRFIIDFQTGVVYNACKKEFVKLNSCPCPLPYPTIQSSSICETINFQLLRFVNLPLKKVPLIYWQPLRTILFWVNLPLSFSKWDLQLGPTFSQRENCRNLNIFLVLKLGSIIENKDRVNNLFPIFVICLFESFHSIIVRLLLSITLLGAFVNWE